MASAVERADDADDVAAVMVRFEVSSQTFGGFSGWIDLRSIDAIEDIGVLVRSRMSDALLGCGFEPLAARAAVTRLCVHGHTLDTLLALAATDATLWVCDHCMEHRQVDSAAAAAAQ
jgi:hypothetical protein